MLENLPCNAGDVGLISDLGNKILRARGWQGQLSLCSTATEPVCCNGDPDDETKTQCSQINKIFFKILAYLAVEDASTDFSFLASKAGGGSEFSYKFRGQSQE